MDTSTLQYVLDKVFPELAGIVCASDELLAVTPRRLCYIVNTDPISKPGQHWVLIVRNRTSCYYFDSYGDTNTVVLSIVNFLSINCKQVYRNKSRFQSDASMLCGVYCLFVLHSLVHCHVSFKDIVFNTFSTTDLFTNDILLDKWFRKFHEEIDEHSRGVNNTFRQSCTSNFISG